MKKLLVSILVGASAIAALAACSSPADTVLANNGRAGSAGPPNEPTDSFAAPDIDAIWTQILTTAGHKGWNLPEVESQFRIRMGKDPSEADAATMVVFRDELQAGKL